MAKNNHNFEKRKHVRVAVDAYVWVTLTTDKDDAEKIFTAKDISPEGIFLVSNETFPAGTILNLRIHTPTTLEPINTAAEVVRTAVDKNLGINGVGLVFIQISEKDKKELLKHLYLAYHYTDHTDNK